MMDVLQTKYVPLIRVQAIKERFVPYGDEENIDNPQKVVRMVSRLLKNADREYLLVISVDADSKPVGIEVVAVGSLNVVYVEAREVFKHAILSNASGIIMVHNHPSGTVTPSSADFKATQRMMKAGEIIGIELLDHIIIGENELFLNLKSTGEWEEMKNGSTN